MQVPIYYDPMLAKLVTFGADRPAAIRRMREAIASYQVEGVQTTLSFGDFVCRHPAFLSGDFSTHFVQEHYRPELLQQAYEEEASVAAGVALRLYLDEIRTLRTNQS